MKRRNFVFRRVSGFVSFFDVHAKSGSANNIGMGRLIYHNKALIEPMLRKTDLNFLSFISILSE